MSEDMSRKQANRRSGSFAVSELQKASRSCRSAFDALDSNDISPYLSELAHECEDLIMDIDSFIREITGTLNRL